MDIIPGTEFAREGGGNHAGHELGYEIRYAGMQQRSNLALVNAHYRID